MTYDISMTKLKNNPKPKLVQSRITLIIQHSQLGNCTNI